MKVLLRIVAAAALLVQDTTSNKINSQEGLGNGDHDRGNFQDPSARVRTKFRYWVPDASIDIPTVKKDIAAVKQIGGGGIELLPYYNYGDITPGVIGTDWVQYGWGTPAWRVLQDAAIQATKDNNMMIDLALGPNQGAGIPAPVDADGLQWDLQPFNVSVPIGASFNDTIPGWGTGKLVAATTGLVKGKLNTTSGTTFTLATSSLHDVTQRVADNGHLDITFPENDRGEYYVIFAYFLIHTQYREQRSPLSVVSGEGIQQSPVTTYVQNGSWVVDHFSARGADQTRQFWAQHLLNGIETTQLLREVGRYLWEDSQEYPSNILWTPKVPKVFQRQHGYSIAKYLPILLHGNGGGIFSGVRPPTSPVFMTDEADGGHKYVVDFRQTMTDLNKDYLAGLTKFAKTLGMQSSAQVGYNLPIDMLSNIPYVDAPECESLGFDAQLDTYRQFSGPAGLAGKQIVSLEAGAVFYTTYQQTVPEQLYYLKRSVIGGVNSFVLHGMPFSGAYANTTWPGYVPFGYVAAEMHSQRQPGWDYYEDWMNYTARIQYAMQTGVAKVDVAFWLKNVNASLANSYHPNDLAEAGYTYEFLSPDNFALPNAYVEDGILAPTQQAFKALIVRANDTLTTFGVEKLAKYAHQGLKIVFAGGVPLKLFGNIPAEQRQYITATISAISRLPNGHIVSETGLASSLAALGIKPRLALGGSNNIWYSRWRETDEEAIIFVYYDATGKPRGGPAINMTVTFAATGSPYSYDAWTGLQTPLRDYTQTENTTTLSLTLAGNQTNLIAFRKHEKARTPETSQSKSHGSTRLSTPIQLSNWALTIESWSAPLNISDVDGTVKRNQTYQITELVPWNQQNVSTDLTNIAGRGYYHTTFARPSTNNGAYIKLSPILHTAVLFVNGHKLPPLDVTAPKADISEFMTHGVNTVDIVISTPLGNALLPVADKLRSAGADMSFVEASLGMPIIGAAEYGLVGEVVIQPY